MSTQPDQQFDPLKYKETTTEQWQTAAEPWHRWGPTLEEWLGQATEVMLEMAEVGPGVRVLDVAAGGGGQTIAAAKRVGSVGYVLATDISSNILEFASAGAQEEGLTNVETRVVDGEELEELEEVRGSGRLRGSVRAGRRGGCQIGRLVSELPRKSLFTRVRGMRILGNWEGPPSLRGCYELDQEWLGNAESGGSRGIGSTGESAFPCGFHPSS